MDPARINRNETAARNINALTYAHKLLIDGLDRYGRTEQIKKAYENLDEAFYAAIRAESERIVLNGEANRNTVTQ